MTTAVDIAKPICQAQRAATGVVADMTTETQVLFLICANLRNLRIGCVTSVKNIFKNMTIPMIPDNLAVVNVNGYNIDSLSIIL
jgi:hypothetical protein